MLLTARRDGIPLAAGELLGLHARVVASGHPGYLGLEGRVVEETQGTFVLATAAGEKTVPKRGQAFTFTLPDGGTQRLEGAEVAHRPEDRTRKAGPARRARSTR